MALDSCSGRKSGCICHSDKPAIRASRWRRCTALPAQPLAAVLNDGLNAGGCLFGDPSFLPGLHVDIVGGHRSWIARNPPGLGACSSLSEHDDESLMVASYCPEMKRKLKFEEIEHIKHPKSQILALRKLQKVS